LYCSEALKGKIGSFLQVYVVKLREVVAVALNVFDYALVARMECCMPHLVMVDSHP
jgi:hypothetical protein